MAARTMKHVRSDFIIKRWCEKHHGGYIKFNKNSIPIRRHKTMTFSFTKETMKAILVVFMLYV